MTLAVALAVPAFVSTSANAAGSKFSTYESAKQAGGINALAKECKKEGELNTIATPRDWANYGAIYDLFKKKYKVKVNIVDPNAGSQDELNAAINLKGTKRSPDVFDISPSIAAKYQGTGTFAAYKVINWAQLPSTKNADGFLAPDYTGVSSVGYDGSLGTVTNLDDLLGAKFKGLVALNGNPMKTGAGMAGLQMVNRAKGGTFSDVAKGVKFFADLKAAGNFINVDPTPATIEAGQTRVVIDWSYNNKAVADKFKAAGKSWKIFIPAKAQVGSFYYAGVSAWAPHPACARLWQETIFSIEGANAWAEGGAIPALWPWIVKTKKYTKAAVDSIGLGTDAPSSASATDLVAANAYLASNWDAAVGTK